MANVTIDGVEYAVQMDTGSSDLWLDLGVRTPTTTVSPLRSICTYHSCGVVDRLGSIKYMAFRSWRHIADTLSQTGQSYNLTYGSGYAYGDVVRGAVSFAG